MGFWDQVKGLFGGRSALEQKAANAIDTRVLRRRSFTTLEIADEVTRDNPSRQAADIQDASRLVERLLDSGWLSRSNYVRTPGGEYKPSTGEQKKQSAAPNPKAELEQKIRAILVERARLQRTFTVLDIADEATRDNISKRTAADIREARVLVEAVLRPEWLTAYGYEKNAMEVFGPKSVRSNAPPPAKKAAPREEEEEDDDDDDDGDDDDDNATRTSPGPTGKQGESSYDAGGLLGLGPEEIRKRALQRTPWRSEFTWRRDLIPASTDTNTQIIDRLLVLGGYVSETDLKEMHRVGDTWIEFKEAELGARLASEKAVEAEKERRKQVKAQKQKEAALRHDKRRADIKHRRETDIVFLGRGVSHGLSDRRVDVEKLEKRGLPVLASPADIAKSLGLPLKRLRWLAYHSAAAERTHYTYFEIPKRSGGTRLLSAPMPDLAKAQQWVLANILEKLPVEEAAHGFIPDRSTVTNARPHLGKDAVVNQDLANFFPTITFPRVCGVFQALGYSPAAATVLALLCTESPRRQVDFGGKKYWAAVGPRALPQGACTSPAISNQIARKLDRRLTAMCAKHGWTYTRYADDLTFSAGDGKMNEVPMFLARVRHVCEDEGFAMNPKKGRVQRASGRQLVTGIVVNEKPGLAREEVRRLRAILHGAKMTGLAAQNRENLPHFAHWLRGKIAYLAMVDREKGLAMLRELDALKN